MDCNKSSFFTLTLSFFRPSFVILWHLLTSQSGQKKEYYPLKSRFINSRELALFRYFPSLSRPPSVMFWQLLASQIVHFSQVTHIIKFRLMDFKELSFLKPSPRFFKPSSVTLSQLSSWDSFDDFIFTFQNWSPLSELSLMTSSSLRAFSRFHL